MTRDDQTPVVIGVGATSQRHDTADALADPARSQDALGLMHRAVDAAIADSGAPSARDAIGWIGVPEGTWRHLDPGRLLARRMRLADADGCATVVADVGITQQDLLNAACLAVTQQGAGVAVVVGGEAKHRESTASRLGVELPVASDAAAEPADAQPDVHIKPASLGVTDLEIVRNIVSPVAAYALIENAIGHARGRSVDEHRDAVAALLARFAHVAAGNPRAWDRTEYDAAAIRDASAGNRMISFPHTKRHSSQWNVDQAAAVVVCSLATARALGVADDRLVFPLVSTVANHAVPLSERRDVERCVGAELAGAKLVELLATDGRTVDDLGPVDLYSCFPSAVELYADALGLDVAGERDLTVTGGMAFAGGPLNNYVLQAMAELVERLRRAPDEVGLSSSVSGYVMKQGFATWSATPPRHAFTIHDVTEATRATTETVAVVDREGVGRIVSWTVDFAGGAPARAVALVDLDDGARTIAVSEDAAVADHLITHRDPIGVRATVAAGGGLQLD